MCCGNDRTGMSRAAINDARRERMANRQALAVPPSRVRFIAHAPKDSDQADKVFSTVFEARAWAAGHQGWILEAKRIPV